MGKTQLTQLGPVADLLFKPRLGIVCFTSNWSLDEGIHAHRKLVTIRCFLIIT